MNAVTQPMGPCPCNLEIQGRRCTMVGTKLTRYGHLVACSCPTCTGRRNKRSGQRAQAKMHKRLGGEGFTPTHEEAARPYTIEVTVMPESKTGGQVPANWDRFIATDWFRRALDQSTRATPVGSGVLPAVVIRGDWAIVDIRGHKREQ
jgi:hypothetical protein